MIRFSLSVATFLFLLLISCNDDQKVSAPLSEDEMVNTLIQIHLNEAKAINTFLPVDSQRLYYKILEDSMWYKLQTTRVLYDSSYKMYARHAYALDKIYTRVIDSLSLREALRKL
ncbi:MAG: DUF4296 domain-containing protein [Cytophagales bacterium]|nr:DUF4296 domain-containing protein [Cytophagales bacterium]